MNGLKSIMESNVRNVGFLFLIMTITGLSEMFG